MCLLFILLKLLTISVLEINSLPPQAQPKKVYETLHLRQMDGYYYNWLSTPNYPSQFTTPHVRYYMINSTNLQGFKTTPKINIYLTELFLASKENIKVTDSQGPARNIALTSRILSTTHSTISIDVNVTNLFRNHIRIKELFNTKFGFNNHFGFNISIEVVDSSLENPTWSCSILKCSFAGTCRSFPSAKRLEFRCDCMEGFSGTECQYGPECNPERNINFCLNGGKCRSYGYGGGCDCLNGYSGVKCQLKPRKINFVSENEECSLSDPYVNDRPCSLCNNFTVHKDWNRYLVRLKENAVHEEIYKAALESLFDGDYYNHFSTVLNNALVLVIYGQLREESKPIPHLISVIQSDSVYSSRNESNYTMQPEIKMNKEKELPLGQQQEFSLTCKCNIPPNSNDSFIQFKWFKDNVLIQAQYTTSYRHISQFDSVQEDGQQMFSILMIDYTSPFDVGVFTCQVTDLISNVQECADYYMEVVIPPQIDVVPMSVTMVKNSSKLLMCSDSTETKISGSQKNEIKWFKNEELITNNNPLYAIEDIIPYGQGKLLRILNAQDSGTFVCRAKNKGGEIERAVTLKLLESWVNAYDSCPGEWKDYLEFRMTWEITAIGQTAMNKCPDGFLGYAQRQCILGPNGQGKWTQTDFSRCTHRQLERFNFTLHSMENGYRVKREGLSILHIELDKYLEMRRGNNSELLLGEGDKFINMWIDTTTYLRQLVNHRQQLVEATHTIGLIAVVDKFIGFGHSCVQQSSTLYLLEQFMQFMEIHKMESYEGDRIIIRTFTLSINNSESVLLETNSTNSRLIFHYWPMDEGALERQMTFVKLLDIWMLNEDEELISDIISVNISDRYYLREATFFEIQFETKEIAPHKYKTCAVLSNSQWILHSCSINITDLKVSCFCNRLGTYAVLAKMEEQLLEPKADELIQLPDNWIATSGCIVCLVLCFRSLVCTLLRKILSPYYLLATGGIITSYLCLLFLILENESRAVGMLYMSITLSIKSLRIWRMVWIYDMTELFPWLEKVSKWILLIGIIFTQILPLLTVFIFDTIFTDNQFVLHQDSPVFVTFAILVFLSVLAIFFVHYKTYLRVHQKNSTNNNNHGGQKALKENFCCTIIHLLQILSLVLYLNVKHILIFHYLFAICNCILGLSWRSPEKVIQKRQNNPVVEVGIATTTNTAFYGINGNNRIEMIPLGGGGRKMSRPYTSAYDDDDEENDHVTIDTSVSLSVSTISNTGSLRPYFGNLPGKGKCLVRLDDNYVLPSN